MVEIGIVYPHLAERPRRYVASAKDGTFWRQERVEESLSVLEQAQPGSASVSSPKLQGQTVMVTTCASLTHEGTLCVALSWTTNELESPVQMELDLQELAMGPLVAVKTFEWQKQNQLRLVMVDAQGKILTLGLNENLVPNSGFSVLELEDYIESSTVLQRVAGSELQSTMVTFLDSNTIIIALNPFILTVDLSGGTSHCWSELQCLEEMRSRASKLGNLLTNMSDIFLGREDESLDMAPTAAICLAPNTLNGAQYCFTLHADAKLRKWKLNTNVSYMPVEVRTLNPSDKLPLPSSWNDGRNAVCLSARLYGDVYALAVQVRTAGVIDISQPSSSDCHLFVLWGDTLLDTNVASIKLRVPPEALGVVGMDFIPTQKRCTLSVLLECSTEQAPSTMQLTYGPSNIAIIRSEPIAERNGNLDQIATKERNRIRCLSYGSIVADKMSMESDQGTLEESLHELDSLYMKYLFRPIFPRGTGTILAPSDACIRNALSKLVQGAAKLHEPGISIELETLKTMHYWRQMEHKRSLALAGTSPRKPQRSVTPLDEIVPAAPKTLSVYDSFVQHDLDDGEDDEVMQVDDQFGNLEQLQQERTIEIEAHENRWRRFLLQVWEEEQVCRVPLTVSWLESIPLQVIIRAGVTSAIPERREEQSSRSPFDALDAVAAKLIKYVEEDEVYQARVNHLEQHLVNLVSKGEIAVSPDSLTSIRQGLQDLGAWAWSSDDDVISDEEHTALEEAASRMSSKQLMSWIGTIQVTGDTGLPGLGLVTAGDDGKGGGGFTWSQSRVANCQLRHSACYFTTVCLDSVRRLQLSRCLLLGDLIEGGHAREAALVAYVHSVSMLWVAAQRVPMPSTALQTKRVQIQIGSDSPDSPPNKRLSFGDDSSSILAPASRSFTTSMDVMMIEISQTMNGTPSSFPSSHAGAALLLSRIFFKAVLGQKANVKSRTLPELGILPKPRDDSVATDYPRLALRLLAPFVVCTLPEDPVDVILCRKESLAECLLIESHSDSLSDDSKNRMREMARLLLEPSSHDFVNQFELQQIDAAFSALKSREQIQVPHSMLVSKMGAIVHQSGSQTEIGRLCELDTVKKLFSSIASDDGAAFDDGTQEAITCLANSLLHLSRVIHKLSILARHVGANRTETDAGNSEIILSLIADATNQMEKTFPEHICQQMSEYSNFWSSLFFHSVSAGKWRQAYEACMRNPLIGRRESNFRRLVRSMVDCGALGELIELCTELGTSMSAAPDAKAKMESVDLYEIASEILADTRASDLYMLRAQSTDPSQLSDYQGALYALHASQEQWRRAAQSMDIRYVNAKKAMKSDASALGLRPQDAELRDHLIVEDLTLASVGALNAMNLVSNPAHQFLVSGEQGRYLLVPIDGRKEPPKPKSIMKRSRKPEGVAMDEDDEEEEETPSRLSRYMSLTELHGRSLRSIALRTMYFDTANTRSFAKDAFLRDLSSSAVDINELFNTGYFRYGLLLSKAFANSRNALTGSHRQNGKDIFYASIVHLLHSCLIPVSTSGAIPEKRPTIQQLLSALDGSGDSDEYSSCIVTNRSTTIAELESVVLRTAGWAFIRKLALSFSTAETPVALDVADGTLSQGAAKLPSWLENLVLGSDLPESSGKFARKTNPKEAAYSGNPQALLSLYTKQGMFIDACKLVSKILTVESPATSRLPESGDIDYVPYDNIDFLWNLIDVMLSTGEIPASAEEEILSARDEMEKALKRHFSLLHISDMGLKSARALKGKQL